MIIQHNISLKPFNTFGIDVPAKAFSTFTTENELTELLEAKEEKENLMVLGGGSNILLTKPFDGLVVHNRILGMELVAENAKNVCITVGAGENWHRLVLHCINRNWAGIENLSLIPGCVGASPMQNIGAYGVELKDVFESLEAINIHDRTLAKFSKEDCQFGYRESIFKSALKGQFIITRVTFRLDKNPVFHTSYGAIEQELEAMKVDTLSIKAISDAVIRIRQSKLPDPALTGNAGSFFKNPEIPNDHFELVKLQYPSIPSYPTKAGFTKVPAGWLIEHAGWKGYRDGDAGVHPKQALVLVNYGHATGQQILALSKKMVKSIENSFGIHLEREVNIY